MTDDRRRAVRAALEEGRRRLAAAGLEEPLREAELLLAAAAGTERVALHADPPPLDPGVLDRYGAFLSRRERREPAAYILGEREFRSLRFAVTPAVLVPRPETEHLVEAALRRLAGIPRPVVVDAGTGSGCIAVSLAVAHPGARVLAPDRSAAALSVARANARRHGVAERVLFVLGDLLDAVRGPVDLVVSNPPYVEPGEAVDPEVLHEPREAVFAEPGVAAVYARLAWESARVLRPGGRLLVETPGGRVPDLAAAFRAAGLRPGEPLPDLAGRPRVLEGIRPPAAP